MMLAFFNSTVQHYRLGLLGLIARFAVLCLQFALESVWGFMSIVAFFTSGYLEDALIRNQALEGGTAFLIKPFSKAELATKLRDVLGEGADGAEIGRAQRS